MDYQVAIDENGKPYLRVHLRDYGLIKSALLNKGMAFTRQEREEFRLLGLIPPHEATLATQRERSYLAFKSKVSVLEKYIYLRDLQDSNETLFYSLISHHIEEMMPIVYTPTVGLGCQRFSHIYRRPRGLFIAYPYMDQIDKIFDNERFNHVKVIVVSDGERILGLGDQGAGGMGISIGKLALYSACAGIHPAMTLPILLDTGTNNQALREDPLYIGWRHERLRGKQYDDFVDAFVTAVKKRFPHILLHWEDFAQPNARTLLERYRDKLCTFNDDIQGTAAMTVGTLLAAIRITGISLREQRIVIAGAGSAGCGIAELFLALMESVGISAEEAAKQFYIVDKDGLLISNMPQLTDFQRIFAQPASAVASWTCKDRSAITLEEVIANVKPTTLIGASGQGGLFTEAIIRAMAKATPRPVIFPLSNPIEKCEASPQDIMAWTHDKAIIGTGSPFRKVKRNGKPFRVDQTNNSYIFPGLGLALIAMKARHVTTPLLLAAARTLADLSPAKLDENDNLLPPLSKIREVSLQVALSVAKEATALGLADFDITKHDLKNYLQDYMWVPEYLPYKKV